jgi:hypothetical protein
MKSEGGQNWTPITPPRGSKLHAETHHYGIWFNNRLLEPIGNIPPAEAEERYYARLDAPAMAA